MAVNQKITFQNESLNKLYKRNKKIGDWIEMDFQNLNGDEVKSYFMKKDQFKLNELMKALIVKEFYECYEKSPRKEITNDFWLDIEPILKKITPDGVEDKKFLRECSIKLNNAYKTFVKNNYFKERDLKIPNRSQIQYNTKTLLDTILIVIYLILNEENNEIPRKKLTEQVIENHNFGNTELTISGFIGKITERYLESFSAKFDNKKVEFVRLTPLSRLLYAKKENIKVRNELLYLGFRIYNIIEQVITCIYRNLKEGYNEIDSQIIKDYIQNQDDFYLYPTYILNNVQLIIQDLLIFKFTKRIETNRLRLDFYSCSLEAFVFSLYDYLLGKGIRVISIEELLESPLLESWLLLEETLLHLLKEAASKGLIRWEKTAQLNQISLPYNDMEDLVDAILNI